MRTIKHLLLSACALLVMSVPAFASPNDLKADACNLTLDTLSSAVSELSPPIATQESVPAKKTVVRFDTESDTVSPMFVEAIKKFERPFHWEGWAFGGARLTDLGLFGGLAAVVPFPLDDKWDGFLGLYGQWDQGRVLTAGLMAGVRF